MRPFDKSRGDRAAEAISSNGRTSVPSAGPSPLQVAYENYTQMEMEVLNAREERASLRAQNGSLVSEVSMLREQLARSDADRVRLQASCSTLLGRLLSINDTIAGAVKAAVKDGIDAAQAHTEEQRQQEDHEAAEAAEIIQRTQPVTGLGSVDWNPPR